MEMIKTNSTQAASRRARRDSVAMFLSRRENFRDANFELISADAPRNIPRALRPRVRLITWLNWNVVNNNIRRVRRD